jgi:hypothetical protein
MFFKKIVISTYSTNAMAINLFKKYSVNFEGKRLKQFKEGAKDIDEVLMAKFL